MQPEETFVYFIQRGYGAVKIGVSKNPESRCKQLQTGNFKTLHVIAKLPCKSRAAAMTLEKTLHRRYNRFRLNNGEWFKKGVLRAIGDRREIMPQIFDREVNDGTRFNDYGPESLKKELLAAREDRKQLRAEYKARGPSG